MFFALQKGILEFNSLLLFGSQLRFLFSRFLPISVLCGGFVQFLDCNWPAVAANSISAPWDVRFGAQPALQPSTGPETGGRIGIDWPELRGREQKAQLDN